MKQFTAAAQPGLKYITVTQCPHCGSGWQHDEVGYDHCGGKRMETRRFHCGHVVEFIPNFDKERVKYECPRSNANVLKRAKRLAAAMAIIELVFDQEVDKEFKDSFIHEARRLGDVHYPRAGVNSDWYDKFIVGPAADHPYTHV